MTRKYILAAGSICLSLILSILLFVGMFKIGILESKMILSLGVLFFVLVIASLYTYFSKNQNIYNSGVFLSFLFNIVLIYNVSNLNIKYDYIRDLFNDDYKYVTYNVYVQRKTTTYDRINKLDGRKIGVLKESFNHVSKSLSDDAKIEFVSYNDMVEIENAIVNGEIQSFALTEDDLKKANEMDITIMKKVRVIYTNKYKDSA